MPRSALPVNGPPSAKRTIMVAVDFSECSTNALRWAVDTLNLSADDRLVMLAVVAAPSASERPSVRRDFDQTHAEHQAEADLHVGSVNIVDITKLWSFTKSHHKEDAFRFLDVAFRVETSDSPKEHIVDRVVNAELPSILVVGSHGKTGAKRVLGSVSDYAVRNSFVPVIVVKDPTHLEQLKRKSIDLMASS